MRQIILDTETTGLDPKAGHKIIEIGCIELENRRFTGRTYHQYIQPLRPIDKGAEKVHGITQEFLKDKPTFKEIVEAFLAFVSSAELIIHNAPFDVGFINHEFYEADLTQRIEDYCSIFDTLAFARKQHAGQRNSLDALCKRYHIDNTHRQYHGALLDARILGDVYLAMTSGQTSFDFSEAKQSEDGQKTKKIFFPSELPVVYADADELRLHQCYLDKLKNGLPLF